VKRQLTAKKASKKSTPEDDLKGISERLMEARESFGLSQTAMAEALGVTRGYIHRIEKAGEGGMKPSIAVLVRASRMYSISLDWLLLGQGSMLMATESTRETMLAVADNVAAMDVVLGRLKERLREGGFQRRVE